MSSTVAARLQDKVELAGALTVTTKAAPSERKKLKCCSCEWLVTVAFTFIALLLVFFITMSASFAYGYARQNDRIVMRNETCDDWKCSETVRKFHVKFFLYAATLCLNLAKAFGDSDYFIEALTDEPMCEFVLSAALVGVGAMMVLFASLFALTEAHTDAFVETTYSTLGEVLFLTAIFSVGDAFVKAATKKQAVRTSPKWPNTARTPANNAN